VGRRIHQKQKAARNIPSVQGRNNLSEEKPLLKERPQYGYTPRSASAIDAMTSINDSEEDLSAVTPAQTGSLDSVPIASKISLSRPIITGPSTPEGGAGRSNRDKPSLLMSSSVASSTSSLHSYSADDLSNPRRKHKRTKSLEGQFHYSSSSESILTGGQSGLAAERESESSSPQGTQQQSAKDRENLRHSFHGIGLSELELRTIDARILTPALKARIAG
jgi:hypothetical protein